MKQKPKKHHYVPECYLDNFLREGKFFTLDIRKVLKGFNEFPRDSNPSKICYFEDYYKIEEGVFDQNVFNELFVELEVLKNLEDKYLGLYQKVITENQLSLDDSILIANFIVQLKLRNPYWYNNQQTKIKKEVIDSATLESFEFEGRFDSIPKELKQFALDLLLEKISNNPKFDKMFQLRTLIRRYKEQEELNNGVIKAMVNCKWNILCAPDYGPFFITTDNPGISLGIDKLFYNTRFTGGFTFYLPLSPKYCLCITDYEKDNVLLERKPFKQVEKLNINQETVFGINDSLIQRVNKLLIAADKSYLSAIRSLNSPNPK